MWNWLRVESGIKILGNLWRVEHRSRSRQAPEQGSSPSGEQIKNSQPAALMGHEQPGKYSWRYSRPQGIKWVNHEGLENFAGWDSRLRVWADDTDVSSAYYGLQFLIWLIFYCPLKLSSFATFSTELFLTRGLHLYGSSSESGWLSYLSIFNWRIITLMNWKLKPYDHLNSRRESFGQNSISIYDFF